MEMTIKIPNVSREGNIGSVFNYLYYIIKQTGESDDNVVWDFSDATFFHPFFIAPLSIYRSVLSNKKNIECKNVSGFLPSYFGLIRFYDFLNIDDSTDLGKILGAYNNKSYIPVCRFDLGCKGIDSMQTIIQKVIENQKSLNSQLKTPISYLLGELVCNMQQHSKSKYGYMFSQYLSKDNSLYICLADTGITIYGSYVNSGKYEDRLTDKEADALKLAVEGYSTKDKPDAENRGFGISTNIQMITDGLGGGFFIMSGGAFYRRENGKDMYVNLPDDINWDGTIILVRIPIKVNSSFDYMKYMQ